MHGSAISSALPTHPWGRAPGAPGRASALFVLRSPSRRHHQFVRRLDAAAFVAVTKTYGGHQTDEQHQAVESILNDEFDGVIEKVEDAVLYFARRR
jgi:hypothetical protein